MKKNNEITIRSSAAEYLTYVAATGSNDESIEMRYEDENIWLTQKMMATLYDVGLPTINEHIKNIYADGELSEATTLRKFGNSEFSTKPLNFYNLDMVISVGYRVRSQRGVQFRLWAAGIIKEYMRKGFAMDDARLKELGGGGYFKELLAMA